MHLVVDDQAPVAGVEQLQVRVDALPPGRHHLVRGDGDRADLLALAGVLADLVLGEGGPPQQLVLPLPRGHGVGDEDERGRPGPGHGARADQRLARPAGQDDDARAAVPEAVDGLGLVRPQVPRGRAVRALAVQVDGVGLAVDVAGEVLRGPAELEQDLLDVAALARVDDDGVRGDRGPRRAG